MDARDLVHKHDYRFNSFVEVIDPGPSVEGPLSGVTVGVKDCFYDGGRTPTMGSKVFPPSSTTTAVVLERLRSAGADIVGYTNLHEWAIGGTSTVTATGPIRNPWNSDLIAGGSSGGSAAALAAGFVDVALGSDTGGSIRIPAGCCGVVGLKPTQGRVPTAGYVGDGGPTDQIGPMGRDVASVRALFECMVDERLDPVDPGSLRIGIASGFPFDNIKPEVGDPYSAALEVMRGLGRTFSVEVPDWDAQWWANSALFLNHTGKQVAEDLRERPLDFNMDAMKVLWWGLSLPDDLIALQKEVQTNAKRAWAAMFERIDVLVTPTLPTLPPPIDELEIKLPRDISHADVAFGRLCGPMNLVGVPCLSIPCGISGGMTVNLSISAAPGRDDAVLALGKAFEDAADRAWAGRIAAL